MLREFIGRAKTIVLFATAVALSCPLHSQGVSRQGDAYRDWRQYVVAPKTPIARPVRIVSTSGNVKDAEALLNPIVGRVATLTRGAEEKEPTNIVLDYGIEVGGVPTFDVMATSGTPELKASYSEFREYIGVDGDKGGTHSADPHRYDTYTVAQPGVITNQYIQGGQRVQMISLTTPGSVSLGSVGIRVTHSAASPGEYRGHFLCSDEELNRIWYAGAYTLQTNMLPAGMAGGSGDAAQNSDLPVIVDGAKRDRSVWTGDLAVQGPTDYYSTFATEYVRNSIKLLGSNADADGRVATNLHAEWPVHTGAGPSPHALVYSANYTLWWVRVLADYYLYTGDKRFLAEEWPTLTKELAWASTRVNKDGLFITDSNDGLDWEYYDGPKKGAVTAFNALYYRVLLDGSELAGAMGQHKQAMQYRVRAEALKNAINRMLFNSVTGLYDISDHERGTVAQDANAMAVLFGVAPDDKAAAILAKLKNSLWTANGPRPFQAEKYKPLISPFISGFELMARFKAGDDRDAFDLLTHVWSRMVSSDDATSTLWEVLTLDGRPGLGPNTSLAHGWAAMPVVALSSQVLGVQPTSAGYSTWSVRPHPGNLEWAEGSVATPAGEIEVRWNYAKGSSEFKLHVSAPKETTGEIALPTFGKSVVVVLNGKTVWSGSASKGFHAHKDGDYLMLTELPGGAYDLLSRSER